MNGGDADEEERMGNEKPSAKSTLSEVLAHYGWRHEPGNPNRQGRIVHTADGECLGQITANETWAALRERGLVTWSRGRD